MAAAVGRSGLDGTVHRVCDAARSSQGRSGSCAASVDGHCLRTAGALVLGAYRKRQPALMACRDARHLSTRDSKPRYQAEASTGRYDSRECKLLRQRLALWS